MADNEMDAPDTSLSEALDARLPSNPIAENSLLTALFENEKEWDEFGYLAKPDWFYDREHRVVFEEMQKAANAGERLTPFAVATRIRDRFSDGEHPAVKVVVGMHGAIPVGDTRTFFYRVQSDYVRRKLIYILKAAASEVFSTEHDDIDELIEVILKRINEASDERLTDDDIIKSSAPALLEPVEMELAYIREHGHPQRFLTTGLKELDAITWGGFRPGHLIVIAGRPGMGKTSLALNLCENVIRENDPGLVVLFFSLEQRTEEIMMKMLAAISQVPFGKLRTQKLEPVDEQRVADAKEDIHSYLSDFIVTNPDGLGINDLVHTVKQVKRIKGRLDLVCVDYVGLMQPELNRRYQQSRVLEIAEITRGLKNLANQESVPILALAQLNRNADLRSRSDQRPRLSDLRDSGSIEQDADMVMMLHRDEQISDKNDPNFGKVQLIVNKNRHGPLGTITLQFHEDITVFEEREGAGEPEPLDY